LTDFVSGGGDATFLLDRGTKSGRSVAHLLIIHCRNRRRKTFGRQSFSVESMRAYAQLRDAPSPERLVA
jgi:diphthamide synthase (EF-2-diphthine--ammonia ligase)